MESKKSYIPVKVFLSYLVLAALIVGVSLMLYSENTSFSETENKIASENDKILKVSGLLSKIYETESLARITIQSGSKKDFKNYTDQSGSVISQIDSLKLLVKSDYQVALLDSVKVLLTRKTTNIKQLKDLKNKAIGEAKVKNAINDLTRMELSLRKLRLEDFVKNPAALGNYQRDVLTKYVDYLNQNIPDDKTNTLSQKALDSMLLASRSLLNDVKTETSKRNELLYSEEKKLLQNELSISAQLRKILSVIEREIIINTTRNNEAKETTLKKIIRIVTIAAIVGLLLTLFFSLLILNDFSKTQSYKKQLEIANQRTKTLLKNREQLISTVSHDLKTPLSTIVGYTELLGNASLNTKQLYYNKNIKSASEYITRLIQDLLDFTQIEAGKIIVDNIPFPLSDVIIDVAHNIQAVYPQKPIELIIHIDDNLAGKRMVGDPFRLRQILTNIIGNAYKFTSEGFIKIDASETERNSFIVRIEDSGIGIANDKQQLIFEEFTQADEGIEKKYGGTGLGLTISKKMAEILGGKLILKSEPGKGSIFSIEFPLQFEHPAPQHHETFNSGKGLTAIILDDDSNLLKLTGEILKQQHFNVLSFTNAHDALEKIKDLSFDFIITDIQMPGLDGFGFLEKLRDLLGPDLKQPVMAITGLTGLDKHAYTEAGFTTVIKKPYLPKELLEIINTALKNKTSYPDVIRETNHKNTNGYSLTSLKSFMPNDRNAVKEVLSSFMATTVVNMKALEIAIHKHDVSEIKILAHKMHPMFRQISADEIGEMLESLEIKEHLPEETLQRFETIKRKIALLFSLLEKESIV